MTWYLHVWIELILPLQKMLTFQKSGEKLFREYMFQAVHLTPAQVRYAINLVVKGKQLISNEEYQLTNPHSHAIRHIDLHQAYEIGDFGANGGADTMTYLDQVIFQVKKK